MTKREVVPLSKSMRWLVGATGLITGAIFVMDYGLGLLSVFLILGALTAGPFPRVGKALTRLGAIIVSSSILPLSFWFVFLAPAGTDPLVTVGGAASLFVIALCDIALLIDVISKNRATKSQIPGCP